MNTESPIEKFSCLHMKRKEPIKIKLNKNEVIFDKDSKKSGNISDSNEDFTIKISSSNIHELIIIPYEKIFKGVLEYLSGEYQGYFVYFSKTIEDRFVLNYELDNGFVKMNGYGLNNLGEFKLIGFINFYSSKGKIMIILEELLNNNNIKSETLVIGDLKVTRQYEKFNNNENSRVIKSFHHRKKIFGKALN